MANQVTGRVLAIGNTLQVPSKDGSKSFSKREIIIDCTREDAYTHERGIENTPSFEFFGEQCGDLDNYKVGQVVTITFELNGSKYIDKAGAQKIFNRIRPYRIEAYKSPYQKPDIPQPTQAQYTAPVWHEIPVPAPEKPNDLPF